MRSFFYKIESNIIKIVEFGIADYDTSDERIFYNAHKLNKNKILSISEIVENGNFKVKGIEIKTDVENDFIYFNCSSKPLRLELMDIMSSFLLSKTKKSVRNIKI
jgi:hypothetical protein